MTNPPPPGPDDHPESEPNYGRAPQPGPPGGPPPAQGYGYGYGPGAAGVTVPYGIDPKTGIPYSDKSKLIAGLLQILLPIGIGRMYMGQTGMGVAQLAVTALTCGLGAVWPFIDGILILVGDPRDADGRPLRS